MTSTCSNIDFRSVLAGKRNKCEPLLHSQLDINTCRARICGERDVRYASKGITLYTLKFINKIVQDSQGNISLTLVLGYSKLKLFGELVKTCKLFHMNDIEIAMWSLILETKMTTWDEFDFPIMLFTTAFQAKVLEL
jgi:hypothetical protein